MTASLARDFHLDPTSGMIGWTMASCLPASSAQSSQDAVRVLLICYKMTMSLHLGITNGIILCHSNTTSRAGHSIDARRHIIDWQILRRPGQLKSNWRAKGSQRWCCYIFASAVTGYAASGGSIGHFGTSLARLI